MHNTFWAKTLPMAVIAVSLPSAYVALGDDIGSWIVAGLETELALPLGTPTQIDSGTNAALDVPSDTAVEPPAPPQTPPQAEASCEAPSDAENLPVAAAVAPDAPDAPDRLPITMGYIDPTPVTPPEPPKEAQLAAEPAPQPQPEPDVSAPAATGLEGVRLSYQTPAPTVLAALVRDEILWVRITTLSGKHFLFVPEASSLAFWSGGRFEPMPTGTGMLRLSGTADALIPRHVLRASLTAAMPQETLAELQILVQPQEAARLKTAVSGAISGMSGAQAGPVHAFGCWSARGFRLQHVEAQSQRILIDNAACATPDAGMVSGATATR